MTCHPVSFHQCTIASNSELYYLTNCISYIFLFVIVIYSQYQPDATEDMWRYGQSLRPYFKDVVSIVRHREEIIEFDGCEVVESESLSFEHCPIIDCGVTDDGVVVRLAMKLVTAISEGEVLYIHCWGGHGRTGTIVCIMLHLMYGVSDFKKNK